MPEHSVLFLSQCLAITAVECERERLQTRHDDLRIAGDAPAVTALCVAGQGIIYLLQRLTELVQPGRAEFPIEPVGRVINLVAGVGSLLFSEPTKECAQLFLDAPPPFLEHPGQRFHTFILALSMAYSVP
jgi:hypothetical protein